MPKNNSKVRKHWRKARLAYINSLPTRDERLSAAVFGSRSQVLFEDKPGTDPKK
jgi:hypothetical protein